MSISIKLKPVRYVAHSQDALMTQITGSTRGYQYYSNGNILYNHVNKTVRVYNIHKINAKYRQDKYKTGPKKGQTKKSVKIQDKQWIAYVYQFDKSVLDLIGKKIVQNDRNFVMKSK